MKIRAMFVSNSSSSSFIVALRKGHTFDEIVDNAGAFRPFAENLVKFIEKKSSKLNSIENLPLARAKEYYNNCSPEEILELAKEEFAWIVGACKELVEEPGEWLFGIGSASYNESYDPIELYFGMGGKIDGDNLKVVDIGY